MKEKFLSLFVLLFGIAAIFSPVSFGQQEIHPSTLKVKVTYNGKGEVNSTHGIHLYLFDTPDFTQGIMVMPVSMNSAWENGRVMTFSGLRAEKVYLTASYGDHDPMGPPPSGAPVGLYGQTEAKPIILDKDLVEIEFTFDDSFTMP
jgi:hypothetical protein